MKVLILGNSENNLKYEWGHHIDQFDIVVRFNNFELNKFKSNVGTKIDFIWLSRPFLNRAKDFNNCQFLTYERYISSAPKITQKRFSAVIPYKIPAPSEQVYSSGINVINHFLMDENNEVVIHGICDGGKSHYWDKRFKVYSKHNLLNEEKLLKTFNITRLHDHVS